MDFSAFTVPASHRRLDHVRVGHDQERRHRERPIHRRRGSSFQPTPSSIQRRGALRTHRPFRRSRQELRHIIRVRRHPVGSAGRWYYLIAKADADDVLLESQRSRTTRTLAGSRSGPIPTFDVRRFRHARRRERRSPPHTPCRTRGRRSAEHRRCDSSGPPTRSRRATRASAPPASAPSRRRHAMPGQVALQIPSGAVLGTYYIFAEADSANVVAGGQGIEQRDARVDSHRRRSRGLEPRRAGGRLASGRRSTCHRHDEKPGRERRSVRRSPISICRQRGCSRPSTRCSAAGRSRLAAGERAASVSTLDPSLLARRRAVLSLCESRRTEHRDGDAGGQQHRGRRRHDSAEDLTAHVTSVTYTRSRCGIFSRSSGIHPATRAPAARSPR